MFCNRSSSRTKYMRPCALSSMHPCHPASYSPAQWIQGRDRRNYPRCFVKAFVSTDATGSYKLYKKRSCIFLPAFSKCMVWKRLFLLLYKFLKSQSNIFRPAGQWRQCCFDGYYIYWPVTGDGPASLLTEYVPKWLITSYLKFSIKSNPYPG